MREEIITYLEQFGSGVVRVDWLIEQIRAIPEPFQHEKKDEKDTDLNEDTSKFKLDEFTATPLNITGWDHNPWTGKPL